MPGRVSGAWGEVFLVAGGPSLLSVDLMPLRGRTVVAVNSALFAIPWASAMFSADARWIAQHQERLAEYTGDKFIAQYSNGAKEAHESNTVPGAVTLGLRRDAGLSDNPEYINLRGSSGYGALNLAYLKRAQRIVLLGYDYRYSEDGPGHWYPDTHRTEAGMLAQWAREFDVAALQLAAAGCEVVNASTDSRITAFRKATPEEVIRQ